MGRGWINGCALLKSLFWLLCKESTTGEGLGGRVETRSEPGGIAPCKRDMMEIWARAATAQPRCLAGGSQPLSWEGLCPGQGLGLQGRICEKAVWGTIKPNGSEL